MNFNVYGKIRMYSECTYFKQILVMKLIILLIIASCFQVSAHSFSQTITLKTKNMPLDKALMAIGKQSNHFFFYKYNELKDAAPVTLQLRNATLEEALKESLKGQGFSYTIDNRTIIVNKVSHGKEVVQALQPAEIKGKVVDEQGNPLQGASVKIKGSSVGGVSDANGMFVLVTDLEKPVLLVSYTGYQSKEITVVDRSNVRVLLQQLNQDLNEVVIVGYGSQQRKDITGSISSMSSEKIKNQVVVSLDNAMAGQMAGVQVSQATGAPGGGSSVRIRGAGSLSAGNDPLYVIDGFPVTNDYNQNNNPLNTINPADIENIQVLKDASATAIYGSRGSNGVVIITTKSGKNGVSRMDLSINSGVQEVEKYLELLNAREYALYINEARNNAWINSGAGRSASDPNSVRTNNVMYQLPEMTSNPDALGEGTDWQREIFRSAMMHNYQLNFSGGNEKTKYFLSAGYLDQDGIILNSDLKRYSFRINVESNVHKRVKVGANLTPSYTFNNLVNAEGNWQGGGIVQSAITAAPFLTPYDAQGNYTKITGLGIGTSEVDNPVKLAEESYFKQGTLRLLGTAFAEVSLLDGLTFKTLAGTDIRNFREHIFSPSIVNPNSVNATKVPTATAVSSESKNWLAEFTLNYKKKFDQHAIDALVGYTAQKEYVDFSSMAGTNFANDNIKTINAAGLITNATTTQEEWALLSYLARINYSFADRYLLTATFRRDGSSRFGADNKWGFFPSVSLGWRLSEEAFLKEVSWLSDLRLRASYGATGNNFISNYGHIGLTGIENYIFGGNGGALVNGTRISNIPNSMLGWEKNNQLDLGLEVSVLKNRFALTVDYYNKKTSDLLLNVPVPTLTGYSTALQNIGKIQNKGWEFTVTSRNLVSAFKWTTDFNLSTNQIAVLELGSDGSPIISRQSTSANAPTHITQIDAEPGSFYGYKVIGVYQDAADIANSPIIVNESKPGQLKFEDVDGDGRITSADRTILGSPFPDFTYGITNTFQFKNIDFSFTLQGVKGFEVLNMARRYYGNYAGSYNVLKSASQGWQSPENPGDGKSPMVNRNFGAFPGSNLVNNVTSAFVEDGSYLRLRNITLGYTVPTSIVQIAGVAHARLNFTVQNAYTWTNYEGYNPEVSIQGGSTLVPGVDAGGYPLARTFMFGLNIGF
ncbi:TonB-dependent receptor [Sphingobacterium alkalisoli]|uniref:TonB-dependent receptor n=2 Tax=Sphingobacterium alkalisoli TaxID=1874115 RepID=A0A4U0GUH8_9SPHI|nr:TonB-dependent receptor [Sphingobacterium alkalisoli]GGH28552.1 SusC/RagA family TonB-linked outer membrane protein [Sphingobacterium alkalisoli]